MPINIKHGAKRAKRKRVRDAVLSIDGKRVNALTNAEIKLLLLAIAFKSGLVDDDLNVDLSELRAQ